MDWEIPFDEVRRPRDDLRGDADDDDDDDEAFENEHDSPTAREDVQPKRGKKKKMCR